jgi:hypothetical protein
VDFVTLYFLLEKHGTIPALVAIAFVLGWVVKRLNANLRNDRSRNDEVKKLIHESIKESEGQVEKTLDDHESRLKALELRSLSRSEFQKEVGELKSSITHLSDRVDAQGKDFRNLIIELWKGKADGKKI